MENRDRDKMSQRSSSTEAGDIERQTSQGSSERGSSSFGQNIGRSENLNEPSSRKSGSVGSGGMKGESSDLDKSGLESQSDSSTMKNTDKSSVSGSKGDLGRGSQGGSRH